MNNLLRNLLEITQFVERRKSKGGSNYLYAKAYLDFLVIVKRYVKDFLLITIGIFCASFGFKGFLLTNHFIDGGATGISLLISNITSIPLYSILLLINIPFVILGYNIIGKQFAIKTSLAIIGLALCVANVEFPNVTNNDILVAIFGGFFLGAGIGFSIRGGAVIDGTEILAIYLSKKFGTTIGDIIIVINVIIFSTAMYFLSVEVALFSMVTYLSASKTLDFIVEGIDEYMGVTIVSTHHAEIKEMVVNMMGRGITIYKGERGYGTRGEQNNISILYTVVTRLELNKI
ncbi:YitT family protein [Sandaracinomonas limnophila]|uniref:YitT family protein n=1 Tax=Sandaracinomonas limnophila TaxID=1862386 RepID=UPI001EEE3F43